MTIDDYIELAKKKATFDARGGNSQCYLFEDMALLYGYNVVPGLIDERKQKIDQAKADGVNVMRIIDYQIDDLDKGKGWTLQERAPGKELHHNSGEIHVYSEEDIPFAYARYKTEIGKYFSRLKQLVSSQDYLDKFVDDWIKLDSIGLVVDPSKPDNFFYDPKIGFSFIDVNVFNDYRKNNNIPFYIIMNVIYRPPFFLVMEEDAHKNFRDIMAIPSDFAELISVIKELVIKLTSAFARHGFTAEEVTKAFQKHGINEIINRPVMSDEEILKLIEKKLDIIRTENLERKIK